MSELLHCIVCQNEIVVIINYNCYTKDCYIYSYICLYLSMCTVWYGDLAISIHVVFKYITVYLQ